MPAKRESVTPLDAADFEAFLAKASAKERAKIEKHLAASDEKGPAHGKLFRQVAATLGTLAPLGVVSAGSNAWQFYVPDGKYRMQVFALEDPGDGTLRVYLPDVLAEGLKAKVLSKTAEPHEFSVRGTTKAMLVEALDAANTPQPPVHVKHMLGWNRKALRLTLPTAEADAQTSVATAELLAMAAKHFVAPPA